MSIFENGGNSSKLSFFNCVNIQFVTPFATMLALRWICIIWISHSLLSRSLQLVTKASYMNLFCSNSVSRLYTAAKFVLRISLRHPYLQASFKPKITVYNSAWKTEQEPRRRANPTFHLPS